MKIKNLTFLSLVYLTTQALFCSAAYSAIDLKIEDVAKTVTKTNFTVLQASERVYQAKTNISFNRGQLLPKLNIWKILRVVVNPASLLETLVEGVTDLAPFIIPSNWIRLKQSSLIYKSEKEALRALWANEVMTAKSLFLKAHYNQEFVRSLKDLRKEIKHLETIAKKRINLGEPIALSLNEIQHHLFSIDSDISDLEALNSKEVSELANALALSTSDVDDLVTPNFSDLSKLSKLNGDDFIFRALDSSPEIRQLEYLLKVVPLIKKEISFSFLGTSSLSRGASGTIFDKIPISNGLGFSTNASLKIAKSSANQLEYQKQELENFIQNELEWILSNFSSLESGRDATESALDLAKNRVSGIIRMAELGRRTSLETLLQSILRKFYLVNELYMNQIKTLENEDRFNRMIFHGDYTMSPQIAGLP